MISLALSILFLLWPPATAIAQTERLNAPMYAPIPFQVRRPLLDVPTCATITDRPTEEILILIQSGRLRLAFDLARPGARRRELRVLGRCLAEYMQGTQPTVAETPASVRAEIDEIFPALADNLKACTVLRLLNCSSDHVLDLAKSGLITVARPGRRGAGGDLHLQRASLVEFLVSRRVAS